MHLNKRSTEQSSRDWKGRRRFCSDSLPGKPQARATFSPHLSDCIPQQAGSQFPDQGSNPHPLHWKHRDSTTEPSGKSKTLTLKLASFPWLRKDGNLKMSLPLTQTASREDRKSPSGLKTTLIFLWKYFKYINTSFSSSMEG